MIIISNKEYEKILIPEDSIRIRVIANSNSSSDQKLKLEVKNEVEKELYKLIENVKNIDEARIIIKNNLDKVDSVLKKYNINYDISYGNNFFPKKIYKNIEYDEGKYESLVITIDKGLGKNWWCVLFPPLCLLDEEENLNDIEYKLYAKEIINKFN